MKYVKIAMKIPTSEGIYAPSANEPVLVSPQVAQSSPIRGLVSFAPDNHSDPVEIDFYGHGLDCWYIRERDAKVAGWQACAVMQIPQQVVLSDCGFTVATIIGDDHGR